ncbi:hypothetical protein EU528_12310 [Candidatus Thorarchaeota archaeon]|nr:MAG: hypothetical protein EU528_12310 [Candidatus Thorarchaeota archaeon]
MEFNLEEVTKRKERALEKIDTDEPETTSNSDNGETRKEQAREKLETCDVCVEDTDPPPPESEGTQMTLEAYVSVKERVEDTSETSEEIERTDFVDSVVIEKENDQPAEKIPEVTEQESESRVIVSEIETTEKETDTPSEKTSDVPEHAKDVRETVSEDVLEELGTREVKMYSPEVRGREVSSAEELEEVITDVMPGMKEHRNYEKMLGQCENHFKAEERFGHRRMVSNGELAEFAEEVNEPEKTVRTWVIEGARPLMYQNLESAMTKEEAEVKIGKIRENLQGVDTYEKLEDRLSHPYHETHTKAQVSYPKDLESARKYYEFLDEMTKGGTIADVSRRVGFSQSNGSRYLEGRIPRLTRKAIETIPDVETIKENENFHIDTPEKYERALQHHPFVKDLPDFKQLDHEARVYTTLTDLKTRGELPDKTVKDLAKENKVGEQQLASWLSERKTQELITRLEIYEKAREFHEGKLAKEAFEHRIDPSIVYEHFQHLKDVKASTPNQLARAIESMYQSSELKTRVQWSEFQPYHSGGPKWLKDVAQSIHEQRVEVETALNQRMGLEGNPDERVRIGVVENKLYIRREDTSEWNWLNIYKNEQFQFESLEDKNSLTDEVRGRLGISGPKRLSDLVDQVTDYKMVNTSGLPNYDLVPTTPYLRGETLHLSLDATGKNIQDIQSRIERIGQAREGVGGIKNPKFTPDENKIKSMFTSVLGAGLSDGHIELSNDGFVYTESNRERVDIVNTQIDKFGDVYRSEDLRLNGVLRTRYASAYGRALERRGLTKGDKSIQNEGFPEWLKEATPEELRDYYGPMWAQDGNFYIDRKGSARFQVDRAVVLRDPSKEVTYEHQELATKEHAELVHEFGKPKKGANFKGLHELSFGGLRDLKEHDDERIARIAQSLEEIVEHTRSKLLRDEREGLASMGVMTTPYIARLTYSENSGRLSVLYHVSTATQDDAMRVGFLCPPEDIRKLADVRKWMKSQDKRRERIRNQLESEGLLNGAELNDD